MKKFWAIAAMSLFSGLFDCPVVTTTRRTKPQRNPKKCKSCKNFNTTCFLHGPLHEACVDYVKRKRKHGK